MSCNAERESSWSASLPEDVQRLVAKLKRHDLRLATAESCTGGLIAHWITRIPGCSFLYAGGVVAYANSAKTALLDVPEALITRHGAVSALVAETMASGILRRLETDVAVSTTGIAGPGGGTPRKPVGTVFIAVAIRNGSCRSGCFQFGGSRLEVQIAAGKEALSMVFNSLPL